MYALLYAANEGLFDHVPVNKVAHACENLLDELKAKHPKVTERVNSGDKVGEADNEVILKVARMIADSYSDKAKPEKGSKES
jgi:F0F1-type ATP synthase alpha subunit